MDQQTLILGAFGVIVLFFVFWITVGSTM